MSSRRRANTRPYIRPNSYLSPCYNTLLFYPALFLFQTDIPYSRSTLFQSATMRVSSATALAALVIAANAAPAELPTHKTSKAGVVELTGSRVQERSPFDWSEISKPFEKVGNFLTGKTDESSNEKRSPIDWDDVKAPFESVGNAITGNTEKNEKREAAPWGWEEFKAPFVKVGDAITGNNKDDN